MMLLQSLSSSSSSSSSLTAQNPNLSPVLSFKRVNNFGFINVARFVSPTPASSSKSLTVKCRQSDYFDGQKFSAPTSPNNSSQPSQGGQSQPKYFVGHTIYKGKAALTVEPKAPEFTPLESGAYKISKDGYVLLQFAPAAGVRVYDWGRKQVFSLSVSEIGQIITLGPRESCEFFHDPFKGKSDEGQVRKVLKVEPLPDGSGHFFNLNVQNKLINLDESVYIPITKAEFAVLVAAFNYMLPYFLGWTAFASTTKLEDTYRNNNTNPRYGGDYEWNR